jgi:DNA mismatch repair protein MutS2
MEEKQVVELEKRELQSKLQKLNTDKDKYEKLVEEIESKKKDIISKAQTEASMLLQNTNREIEKTIRHIRENKAEKKETRKVRDKLKDLTQQVKVNEVQQESVKEKWVEGAYVRLPGQELSGTILSIQGKKAVVQFGLIKTTVDLANLLRGSAAENTRVYRSSGINISEKRASFSSTIDLRGKRGEEALGLVDNFLDEAILLSAGELRILHGKGEGILRKMIRDHLKRNKAVASITDEQVERGGDGISVVVLK